jgi:hypothetical protein
VVVVAWGGRGRACRCPRCLLFFLFHPLVLGPSVLKPHLDDAHVQPGLLRQLLSDVSRGFGALSVGAAQRLELLGRYRCSRSLLVTIWGWGVVGGERKRRRRERKDSV